MPTVVLPLRAANSAASFTRFANRPRQIRKLNPRYLAGSRHYRVSRVARELSKFFPGRARQADPPARCRSNRPGRNSAGSKVSGRFEAARTITPLLELKPSISTSKAFRVCSRSSWPPTTLEPRVFPSASSSSIKIMQGDLLRLAETCRARGRRPRRQTFRQSRNPTS